MLLDIHHNQKFSAIGADQVTQSNLGRPRRHALIFLFGTSICCPPLKKQKSCGSRYLSEVYADYSIVGRADKYEVGNRLNLNRGTVDNIVEYLYQEGLVNTFRMSGSRGMSGYSGINKIEPTHEGIKEIEEAVEKPDSPTEHFPPHSVTFNITGGQFTDAQFQVANKDSSQNITVINQSQSAELKEIVTELKRILSNSDIPGEKKQELEAEVQTIESQSKSPKPKIQIIKDALSSAKGIVEEAAGVAGAAAPLITKIGSWLNGVP